jgi:hypothetical protein
MLNHLVLVPTGGLGNRLLALASARRLCGGCRARCTVLWDWGNYETFFARSADLDVLPISRRPALEAYYELQHRLKAEGGSRQNHRVPTTSHERILLTTCFPFGAAEEPHLTSLRPLAEWLPAVAEKIRLEIDGFRPHLRGAVGMHLRQTDNTLARRNSADYLFSLEAEKIVSRGRRIFLATDNRAAEARMRARFRNAVVTYPKNPRLAARWPRDTFLEEETIADLVDLHLLAACEYVLGPHGSSFSTVASLYNGSTLNRKLRAPEFWSQRLATRLSAHVLQVKRLLNGRRRPPPSAVAK